MMVVELGGEATVPAGLPPRRPGNAESDETAVSHLGPVEAATTSPPQIGPAAARAQTRPSRLS